MTEHVGDVPELALCVINEAVSYQSRLLVALLPDGQRALYWILHATDMARMLGIQFKQTFTDAQIFAAAMYLEWYYAEDLKERIANEKDEST